MKTSQMHLQVIQAVRAQKETADGLGDSQANEVGVAMQWRPALATSCASSMMGPKRPVTTNAECTRNTVPATPPLATNQEKRGSYR